MMYKVKISKTAEKDLDEIADYIAKDNEYRALNFTKNLIDSFDKKISSFPKIGIKRKAHYCSIHKNYLIFYRIKEKEVIIIRIVHGSRYTAYKNFL